MATHYARVESKEHTTSDGRTCRMVVTACPREWRDGDMVATEPALVTCCDCRRSIETNDLDAASPRFFMDGKEVPW